MHVNKTHWGLVEYLYQVCVLVNVSVFDIVYLNALFIVSAIGTGDQPCILPVAILSILALLNKSWETSLEYQYIRYT